MKYFSRCCLFLLVAVNFCVARAAEPGAVRVILVGDSTMATRTGYGDALCSRFGPDVTCINVAKGGRSSGSFRAEGWWDQVMKMLRDKEPGRPDYRVTYVLIQFGHNDQPGKPGRSTDLATEFPENISRYADEVKGAGAVAVLVTPLTRRIFREGVLQNDLKPWADATRRVAEAKRAPLLDLNADSAAAVARMGGTEADTFAAAPPPGKAASAIDTARVEPIEANAPAPSKFDYTHLGEKGAAHFSRMVAQELSQAVPALSAHLKPEK